MSDKNQERISHQTITATGGGVAVGGNVVGSSIHVQTVQNVDVKDFHELLAELRQGLRESTLEESLRQDVEAEVESVKKQAERDKPSSAMILGKLKTVTDVLTGAMGAGEKLVPIARRLGEMAAYLF